MSKYNAEMSAARGERTIEKSILGVADIIWELQGRSVSHRARVPRLIDRTDSGKHYRMPSWLAHALDLTITEPGGLPETEPPTTLVTVHDMLEGIERANSQYGIIGMRGIIDASRPHQERIKIC